MSVDSATQRGGTIHLDSLASFQSTLELTQNRIITNISQKIDSFFEEAQYYWDATSTPTNSGQTSSYLMELTDFLSTVMMSVLIQLPPVQSHLVYRGALAHCANVLMVRPGLIIFSFSELLFLTFRTCYASTVFLDGS